MSHFVLFHWIVIQIFIAHAASGTVVRGIIGQTARLPCFYRVTRLKDISDMCWGKGPCPNSKCTNKILHTTGNRVTFRKSQRYNLQGYISYGDVSLTIRQVKAEDAGTYCCRVEIPGWFNDIKQNIQLEVVRAPPVITTTRRAPISPNRFRETTFTPRATPDHQATTESYVHLTTTINEATISTINHQATTESDVHLTTTINEGTISTINHQTTAETAVLLTTAVPPSTAATTQSPAVIILETIAPPTSALTENDAFPEPMVTTSGLPDFSTDFQGADMRTEDYDMLYPTESIPLPADTKVTTEFPSTPLTSEGTESAHTSLMMEDLPTAATALPEPATLQIPKRTSAHSGISVNSHGKTEKQDDNGDKFLIFAIPIACLIAVSILFILLLSFRKRKRTKKFIIKSLGPVEDLEKDFSGAEGETSVFSL